MWCTSHRAFCVIKADVAIGVTSSEFDYRKECTFGGVWKFWDLVSF